MQQNAVLVNILQPVQHSSKYCENIVDHRWNVDTVAFWHITLSCSLEYTFVLMSEISIHYAICIRDISLCLIEYRTEN